MLWDRRPFHCLSYVYPADSYFPLSLSWGSLASCLTRLIREAGVRNLRAFSAVPPSHQEIARQGEDCLILLGAVRTLTLPFSLPPFRPALKGWGQTHLSLLHLTTSLLT
jgi:hypothetical protein